VVARCGCLGCGAGYGEVLVRCGCAVVLTSAAFAAACSSWNFARVSFTASSACSTFKPSLSATIPSHHTDTERMSGPFDSIHPARPAEFVLLSGMSCSLADLAAV